MPIDDDDAEMPPKNTIKKIIIAKLKLKGTGPLPPPPYPRHSRINQSN